MDLRFYLFMLALLALYVVPGAWFCFKNLDVLREFFRALSNDKKDSDI